MAIPVPGSTDSAVELLANIAELNELKRPRLIELCKQYGIKCTGKNVDLVKKLHEYGERALATAQGGTDAAPVSESVTATSEPDESVEDGDTSDSDPDVRFVKPSSRLSVNSAASTVRSTTSTIRRSLLHRSRPSASRASCDDNWESTGSGSNNFDSDISMSTEEAPEDIANRILPVPKGTTRVGKLADLESSPKDPPRPAALGPAPSPAPFVFGSPFMRDSVRSQFTFTASATSTVGLTQLGSPITLVESKHSHAGGKGPSGIKTAAELVMEEMTRRAEAAKQAAPPISRNGTGLPGSGAMGPTSGSFDGKHKRAFDKMDSITSHYAAKRQVQKGGIAGANPVQPMPSSHVSRSSSFTKLSSSARPKEVGFKRPKLAASTSSSALSSMSLTISDSRRGLLQSTSMCRSTRDSQLGTGQNTAADTDLARFASSSRDPATMVSTTDDSLDVASANTAQDRKRQYEMAKARRKSHVSSRRGKTQTKPEPSRGDSSLLRSTSGILTGAINERQSTASSLGKAMDCSRTNSRPPFRFGSPAASQKTDVQPRKKFDLQASLARPLSWQLNLRPNDAASVSGRPTSAFSGSSLKSPGVSSPVKKTTNPVISSLNVPSELYGHVTSPSTNGKGPILATTPGALGATTTSRVSNNVFAPLTNVATSKISSPVKKSATAISSLSRKNRTAGTSSKATLTGKRHDAMARIDSKARKIVASQKARKAAS